MGATMNFIGLPMWVIYANPSDYPGHYVARLWDGLKLQATSSYMLAPTLEAIRLRLPPDLHRVERHQYDDLCIVETWL